MSECTHPSWECSGPPSTKRGVVRHCCDECDWCWISTSDDFVPCGNCAPTSSCVHNEWQMCGYCLAVVDSRMAGEEIIPASLFITKDSGKREEYDSGMRRDTQDGKPRFDLLLVPEIPYELQFLTRLGQLLARGADKYGDRNWQKANSVEELERFVASGLRHMVQWASGEVDEDHAAAVAFNLMAAEYVKWKLENGDS